MRLNRLLQHMLSMELWAIDQEWLNQWMIDSDAVVEAAVERQRERSVARSTGGIAVVPIHGPISARPDIFERIFGVSRSANVQTISRNIRAALADETVKAVVLDMDSPGGTVSGVPELAAEIYSLRGDKPIIAQVDYLCASAAYYLAAQADDIVASPSAMVGSVGVFIQHMEMSKMLEMDGVTVEFIASNPEKVDGNRFQPLTDSGREELTALVDDAWKMMVADIARGRGATPATVREGYGKGHIFAAADALERGMVDKVRTFAETLQVYGVSPGSTGRSRARAERELELLTLY